MSAKRSTSTIPGVLEGQPIGYSLRALKKLDEVNGEEKDQFDREAEVEVEYAVGPAMGSSNQVPVLISMSPAEATGRTPTDLVCVLDTSWSMTMEATAPGASESSGLSMLDVAKHAVRALLQTLGPEDRFALVEFCRDAHVVFPMTRMHEKGRAEAMEALAGVTYGAGTRLLAGLRAGLDALKSTRDRNRIGHLMVLSDGEAEDRKDVMEALRDRASSNGGQLEGTINCFGFGYEIDSQLLTQIASFSGGAYAFIPDAGFVGTIFVNSISNLVVTMGKAARLILKAKDPDNVPSVLTAGLDAITQDDGTVQVNLGTLQMGQTRDIVVAMSSSTDSVQPFEICTVMYRTAPWDSEDQWRQGKRAPEGSRLTDVEVHLQRSLFVKDLKQCILMAGWGPNCDQEKLDACQAILDACAKRVEKSASACPDPLLKALLEDITGEVGVAFASKENWDKWGRHYVPSVQFAHSLQQCNNFKDPGVQFYGGDIFGRVRDLADEAFNELEPPGVTPAKYRYLGGGKVINNPMFMFGRVASRSTNASNHSNHSGASQQSAQPISMAAFNDRFAGCVDGACGVRLASGERKSVAGLRRGDVVQCSGDRVAEVLCAVRTRCRDGVAGLVELPGGLRLTPHHPVLFGGQWCFPADLAPVRQHPCEAVYSFVLNGSPDLIVDGLPCISLAHGVRDGAARHPYFGTELVLQDLAAHPGFASGLVELRPEDVRRDPATGMVCGLFTDDRPPLRAGGPA